jgi:hypothetical protein
LKCSKYRKDVYILFRVGFTSEKESNRKNVTIIVTKEKMIDNGFENPLNIFFK